MKVAIFSAARSGNLRGSNGKLATVTAGGSAFNTLCAVRWVAAKAKHPTVPHCALVGGIGDDAAATQLIEKMGDVGISTEYLQVIPRLPTGQCCCLIPESGDRAMVTIRGAAGAVLWENFSEGLSRAVEDAAAVYLTSFVLTTSNRRKIAMEIAAAAARGNTPLALNLGSASILANNADARTAVGTLLGCADLVFGNADELRAFLSPSTTAPATFASSSTPVAAVAATNASSVQELVCTMTTRVKVGAHVVITDGPNSTVVGFRVAGASSPSTWVSPLPSPVPRIVDTNGCGDSFVGGFLAGFVAAKSPEECVALGFSASREVIQVAGCVLPPINQMR
jgi:adenosine kinase